MVIISDDGKTIPIECRLTERIYEGDRYYATRVAGHLEILFQNRMIMQDINPLQEAPTVQLLCSDYALGIVDKDGNIYLPQELVKYAHLEKGAVIEGNSDRATISKNLV